MALHHNTASIRGSNMKLIKLTDEKGHTQNRTHWGAGVTVTARSGDAVLCSNTVIHAYRNLNLALLLNPIHGDYSSPRIWEAEGEVIVEDWGKVGCKSLTTIKELQRLTWFLDQSMHKKVSVRFAVLCAESVLIHFESRYPDDNRPRKAIEAAKLYLTANAANAANAAYAAAYAAAYDAAYAAYDAAYAANTAIDFCVLADRAADEVMRNA